MLCMRDNRFTGLRLLLSFRQEEILAMTALTPWPPRWTITDTSVSPDQRFVIYSSIIPVVHLVEVRRAGGANEGGWVGMQECNQGRSGVGA
jgi:hypothetical protein